MQIKNLNYGKEYIHPCPKRSNWVAKCDNIFLHVLNYNNNS